MAAAAKYVTPGRSSSRGAAAAAVVRGEGAASGFVRGGATYVVMDDLAVVPMPASVVSNAGLLAGALSIARVDALEEKWVVFGSDKSKEILEASLQSKTVLTDVFLRRIQV
ncbi:hypothetical protein U9M48_020807 [Paspalum notatum var. saurae]|uniref:Uncharacterized protein n=1 Tax=Paspalum notatum var. saurae TaxID=547442 RepID=A0AAQ3TFK3_PASNO